MFNFLSTVINLNHRNKVTIASLYSSLLRDFSVSTSGASVLYLRRSLAQVSSLPNTQNSDTDGSVLPSRCFICKPQQPTLCRRFLFAQLFGWCGVELSLSERWLRDLLAIKREADVLLVNSEKWTLWEYTVCCCGTLVPSRHLSAASHTRLRCDQIIKSFRTRVGTEARDQAGKLHLHFGVHSAQIGNIGR